MTKVLSIAVALVAILVVYYWLKHNNSRATTCSTGASASSSLTMSAPVSGSVMAAASTP